MLAILIFYCKINLLEAHIDSWIGITDARTCCQ